MISRLVALAVLGGAGCAYRTPPVHLPPATPRVVVGDVEVRDRGAAVHPYVADQLRTWTVELLSQPDEARAASGSPTHVTVRVDVEDAFNWMRGCPVVCLFPALMGTDSGYVTLAVQVTIEADKQKYVGHARATKWGSLYAPASKRALAVALDRALASASAG